MAIETLKVNTTNTTTYMSDGLTAITVMSLCNYGPNIITASINIVKNGEVPADTNIFIKNLEIVPADTYILYQGGEKIVLEDGDYISVICNVTNSLTSITSYMDI